MSFVDEVLDAPLLMKTKISLIALATVMLLLSVSCSKKAHYNDFYHEGRSYIRPSHQPYYGW